METLFEKHNRYLKATPMSIMRSCSDKIFWTERLISIQGAKGVGKSTMIRQYIIRNYPLHSRKALYCSMDSVYFSTHSIVDLAEQFYSQGGEHLFLDEIHKYEGWSREIKEIYDLYPTLKVVISGSSLLSILNEDADLSRRCVKHTIQGLSFREYLHFTKGIELPVYSLDDIVNKAYQISDDIHSKCMPLESFNNYCEYGYYPFSIEGLETYYTKIEQTVTHIIDVEMTQLRKVDISNVRKIKAIVEFLANQVPYLLDTSKMSRIIGVSRNTIEQYLTHLCDAKIINLLPSQTKSLTKIGKPEKIYLENPNMIYALSGAKPQIGTIRECFVVNQLSANHKVEYGKENGDFFIDSKYTFEVGGRDKDFGQIAGVPDSYIIADNMDEPSGRRIPLWMLGFLY